MRITALDHIVLNVADVERSIEFYCDRLGLAPERLDDYRRGEVKFPSVRLTGQSIVDLFPPAMHSSAEPGQNMNHFCVAVDGSMQDLEAALSRAGIAIETRMDNNFGARGLATSVYVRDPDGNVLELRTYEP